jgi:hypothetical protein
LVSGVFGRLVGLERAVALGIGWAYAAPALSASGTVLLVGGLPSTTGAWAYAGFLTRHIFRLSNRLMQRVESTEAHIPGGQ